jgi:hypothetical protein
MHFVESLAIYFYGRLILPVMLTNVDGISLYHLLCFFKDSRKTLYISSCHSISLTRPMLNVPSQRFLGATAQQIIRDQTCSTYREISQGKPMNFAQTKIGLNNIV